MKSQDIAILQQEKIFEAMSRPEFYPHPVTKFEIKETHISKVFLTGDYVYKIKKAVDLGFLDYTSLDKRKFYCQQEIMLNRRMSQDIYLDVVPISGQDDRYSLDGQGQTLEYAVKMRQIPEHCSMLQLLRHNKINRKDTDQLALKLADFYSQTPTGESINSYGSTESICTNCEENFRQMASFSGKLFDERTFEIIRAATRSFLRRRKELFEQRIQSDKIRDCHGDLRSGHIYWADTIQIIDCIEFNERFRYSDIISDLAFLVMDIEYEDKPEISRRLLDRYVHYANDPDAFNLIDFYTCYRSIVRAKVNCFRLEDPTLKQFEKDQLLKETERYLNLAYQYASSFTRPTIWVICGMAASGKSTIARELSTKLDIHVLRSDYIRKEIFGVKPDNFIDEPFGEGLYSQEASSLTYSKLIELGQEELAKGNSVILDATFNSKKRRKEVLELAKKMDVNVLFVECTSPEKVLKDRLLQREGREEISDARLHHFQHLKSQFETLEELPGDLHVRINTQLPIKDNISEILSRDQSHSLPAL